MSVNDKTSWEQSLANIAEKLNAQNNFYYDGLPNGVGGSNNDPWGAPYGVTPGPYTMPISPVTPFTVPNGNTGPASINLTNLIEAHEVITKLQERVAELELKVTQLIVILDYITGIKKEQNVGNVLPETGK